VVLAAGKGTRMRSARPKVLHEVAGRPLLAWVLAAAREARCEAIVVVVGHGRDEVRAAFPDPDLLWVEQREQRGTGDALAQVAPLFAPDGPLSTAAPGSAAGDASRTTLLVLSGDVPLLRAATLDELASAAEGAWGAMAVAEMAVPGSLGRVLGVADQPADAPAGSNHQGAVPRRLQRIVEASDASPQELAVREVNAGLYALPAPAIFPYLARLVPNNAKGELYLTDALGMAAADGETLRLCPLADPTEAAGINDRLELAAAHRVLLDRAARAAMLAGVTVLEPARTAIEPGVAIGADTVIHPEVSLRGRTRIGERCVLGQGAVVVDSELGDDVEVAPYSVLERARVESKARVGPFARLRPGAVLGPGARIGNFVEVKNSTLGAGAKANHLAYVGDATVGAGANLGAGVITCNYDGVNKHRTEVGERAFVGSDTLLVAPVRIGAEATTGAGSVITADVPDGALAVERAELRVVPGWARRSRMLRRRGAAPSSAEPTGAGGSPTPESE
jgi:bifunctional UDP-N-acetylglucosamine pyrophosphorylase/glucosamine-1-phosphate N-acetyltransferase